MEKQLRRKGIDRAELARLAVPLRKSDYGHYLERVLRESAVR